MAPCPEDGRFSDRAKWHSALSVLALAEEDGGFSDRAKWHSALSVLALAEEDSSFSPSSTTQPGQSGTVPCGC